MTRDRREEMKGESARRVSRGSRRNSGTKKDREAELIAALGGDRPASVCFSEVHGRYVWDDVASTAECGRAAKSAQKAMDQCCGHDGDEGKLFPPHVPEAVPLLGEKGFALFEDLRQRIYDRINERYGPAEPVAHLLSWISKGKEGNPHGR